MPGLELITVDVALGGLAENVDKRIQKPGQMTVLRNVRFDKDGALSKRNGHVQRGTLPNGECRQLVPYRESVVALDDTELHIWDEASDDWITPGRLPEYYINKRQVVSRHDNASTHAVDIAKTTDYTIIVWLDSLDKQSGISYPMRCVLLDNNGTVVKEWRTITTTTGLLLPPRIAVQGNIVTVVYGIALAQQVYGVQLDLTDIASGWGTPTQIFASGNAVNPGYDIAADDTYFYVAAILTTNNVFVVRLSSSLLTQGSYSVGATNAQDCVAVTLDDMGDILWIAYTDATEGIACGAINTATWGTALAKTVVFAATSPQTATVTVLGTNTAMVMWEAEVGTGTYDSKVEWRSVNTSATLGTLGQAVMCKLGSSGLLVDGQLYFQLVREGFKDALNRYTNGVTALVAIAATVGTYDTETPRCVAWVGLRDAVEQVSFQVRTRLLSTADGMLFVRRELGGETGGGTLVGGIALYRMAYGRAPCRAIEWNGMLVLGGGITSFFDGRFIGEVGYAHAPEFDSDPAPATGTELDEDTYAYSVVYESIDANGIRHRSPPSTTKTVTLAAPNRNAEFDVDYIQLTNRIYVDADVHEPKLRIYRTLGGETSQRSLVESFGIFDLELTNIPTDRFYSGYNDDVPDDDIDENPFIYTLGGVLDSLAPPGLSILCLHQRRIFGVSAEFPTTVWFTKENNGGNAPEFNDSLLFQSLGAPITALASLGDKLVGFEATGIWVVLGEGPNASGFGSTYTQPTWVSQELGTTQPRSVAETPLGIMFASARGLMRLTPALELQNIGAPVEDLFNANPVVNAVTVWPEHGEVIFSCAPLADSVTGVELVYNYLANAWSHWELHDGTIANAAAYGGCLDAGENRWWATQDGEVFKSDPIYYDALPADYASVGDFFGVVIETPWLRVGALQGFQHMRRVLILADSPGSHGLTLEIQRNYTADASQSKTWTYTELDALKTTDNRLELELRSQYRKVQSAKFKFTETIGDTTDFETPANGSFMNLSGVSLEVGVLPAARRGEQ